MAQRLAWFAGIWAMSVLTIAATGYLIRYAIVP